MLSHVYNSTVSRRNIELCVEVGSMRQNNNRSIYVDADACPVKKEIIEVALTEGWTVIMVASYAHEITVPPPVEWVRVDDSSQSADLYISNRIKQGDVVVTGDFGLAAICIGKKAKAISPRGMLFREEELDMLLMQRYESAKQRRAGKRTRGPKPFSSEDRDHFHISLTNLLRNLAGV